MKIGDTVECIHSGQVFVITEVRRKPKNGAKVYVGHLPNSTEEWQSTDVKKAKG